MNDERGTMNQEKQIPDKQGRYDTCKKCGKPAVQLTTAKGLMFIPDEDDRQGNPSRYIDHEFYTDIVIGAHICMECEEVEDVWIESPHQGDDTFILNWLEEQWSQRLGIGLAHELAARVHLGEDLREVAKELMRVEAQSD